MKPITFLLIIFTAFIFSCSQPVVLELTSLEDEKEFFEGNEVVGKADSNALVFVEYLERDATHLIFYVQIENTSENDFDFQVDKSNIKSYHSDIAFNDTNYNYNRLLTAVDPEDKLQEINSDISKRETEKNISSCINCIGGIFSAAATVISEEENDGESYEFWIEQMEEERIDYEIDMENYLIEKEFWANEALKSCTLNPGKTIGGLVFFPLDYSAKYLKVNFLVHTSNFNFDYKQIKK